MKKILILVGMFVAAAGFSFPALIEINAVKDGIVLEHAAKGKTKVSHAEWLKKNGKHTQWTIASFSAANKWDTMEFSFIPDKSGTVTITLYAAWAKQAADRKFVLFDNVEINGELICNGFFNEKNTKGLPKGWWSGKDSKAEIVEDSQAGKFAVKVNLDNRLTTGLRVEAGKTYIVKAHVKNAHE